MRIEEQARSIASGRGARGIAFVSALGVFGCGGIVREDSSDGSFAGQPTVGTGNHTGGGAVTGSGATTGKAGSGGHTSGAGATGSAATTGKAGSGGVSSFCGNGVIESGESCDGILPGGLSCATATMGARLVGTVRCTSSCNLDVSACTTSGLGSGGTTGAAGAVGSGGFIGQGAQGGAANFMTCMSTPSILQSDCTATCGCKACPDAYAACKADGGCSWILACAQRVGCVSTAQCYQTSCSSIIDRAGGMSSWGAKYADPALSCLANAGCGVACP